MDQALQTPEILTRIMKYIHKPKAYTKATPLARLVCINSVWRELVQRIIWTAPPAESFASIMRARRHLYTPYIRELDLKDNMDATLHTLLSGLPFPRLRELTLGNPSIIDSRVSTNASVLDGWTLTASQYLQPALEHLKICWWGSICSASFFKKITEKCPGLKHIFFSEVDAQFQPDDLLTFFGASHHLESIKLSFSPFSERSALVTSDLLLHLSQIPKLSYLKICNFLGQPEFFQIIKTQNQTPFRSLKTVVISATSKVISAAAQVLPNVVSLSLTLRDGHGAFLENLKAMPSLCHLEIRGTEAVSFTRDSLLALQHLNRLVTLKMTIYKHIPGGMVAPQFIDSDFDLMVSGLSNLKTLEWDVKWVSQSTSVLSSLSKHCPELETLSLDGPFDLQALNNISKVLFPRLVGLTLKDAWIRGVPARLSTEQIGRLIDNHAPVLELLQFRANYSSHPVTKAWRKLRKLDSDSDSDDEDFD